MKKNIVKQRNFVAMDLCTNRQFRNKVHQNKKKKMEKFSLNRELRKYESPQCGLSFIPNSSKKTTDASVSW